ncbi:MAG: hypothetical protein ACYTHM_22500, partial [Planctomycetota bacterium]
MRKQGLILIALILFPGSALLAQAPVPPPPGFVGFLEWIYVPGVSNTGTYTVHWGNGLYYREDAYELEEDVNPAFPSPTLVYQGPAQSFTLTGKIQGTYYYRARGINTLYGTSGPWLACDHYHSVDTSIASVPPAPNPPTGVTAPSLVPPSGVIPISWNAVAGANGYDIQESHNMAPPAPVPNPYTAYVTIANGISQSPFNWAGGSTSYQYRFRLRSFVNVGVFRLYSFWSSHSPNRPYPVTVPPTSATGNYTVSWSSALNATSYELLEYTDPVLMNWVSVYQGSALSTNISGKANGAYYYMVRAWNGATCSPNAMGDNPCIVGPHGTLTMSAGSQNPSSSVLPGTTGVPVLQIVLSADAFEDITVTSFTVLDHGTLFTTGVNAANLYADTNGDGSLDAGDTLLSAGVQQFWSFTFGGFSVTIPASSSATWLVTYDIAATEPAGATILAKIIKTTQLIATGAVS